MSLLHESPAAAAAALLLCVAPALGAPPADLPLAFAYDLLPDSSTVRAHTGSSGLLGFAGHEHTIAVPTFAGVARVDTTDVTRFALAIEVPAAGLRVIDPGEDEGTRARIERDMHQKVLAAAEFPTFTIHGQQFAPETRAAAFGSHAGALTVTLTLHGSTREITIPVTLDLDHRYLRARGKFSIKHSDFGLTRIKVAGVVNVADTIDIDFDLRGRAAAATGR